VVNGGLMCALGRDNWLRLGIWLAIGLAIYASYGRHHSRLQNKEEGVI